MNDLIMTIDNSDDENEEINIQKNLKDIKMTKKKEISDDFVFEDSIPVTQTLKIDSTDFDTQIEKHKTRALEEKLELIRGKSSNYGITDDVVDETELEDDTVEEPEVVEEEEEKAPDEVNPFFDYVSETTDITTFYQFSLSRPLLKAVNTLGYITPTQIQAKCIPLILKGRDICASAKTGSGKTAAFLLPILEKLLFLKDDNYIKCLIIVPTRELANQCYEVIQQFSQFSSITSTLVVGGLPLKPQETALRHNPDIVVCTTGRMIDHLKNTLNVSLYDIKYLILDEADKLLELGFQDELEEIIKSCPLNRQTLLFSATFSTKIEDLIKLSLNKPVRVCIDDTRRVVDNLIQEFVRIRVETNREAVLLSLCHKSFKTNTIIFCSTKARTHRLLIVFCLSGLKAVELHGNLNQNQRMNSLERFKNKEVDFLIATDIAGRGIDIDGVETVINYEIPYDLNRYIHRVGRTARAGHGGRAISLVGEKDRKLLKEIVKRSPRTVKSRTIAPQEIDKWTHIIQSMEKDIASVTKQEKIESELTETNRDLVKAENIIKHADEIKNRPKKTWFQSKQEKQNVKDKEKEQLDIPTKRKAPNSNRGNKKRKT